MSQHKLTSLFNDLVSTNKHVNTSQHIMHKIIKQCPTTTPIESRVPTKNTKENETDDTEEELDQAVYTKRGTKRVRGIPPVWTKEEDELLRSVSKNRKMSWREIAEEVFGGKFTSNQCSQHWNRVIKDGIKSGEWSKEEDETLLWNINNVSSDSDVISWSWIAKQIPGRTDIQCRQRWEKVIKKSSYSRKRTRSTIEDEESQECDSPSITRPIPIKIPTVIIPQQNTTTTFSCTQSPKNIAFNHEMEQRPAKKRPSTSTYLIDDIMSSRSQLDLYQDVKLSEPEICSSSFSQTSQNPQEYATCCTSRSPTSLGVKSESQISLVGDNDSIPPYRESQMSQFTIIKFDSPSQDEGTSKEPSLDVLPTELLLFEE
ncbi:hypothetical protein AKO1_012467 [Acrasis kona]|uniref:Myb-like DNA-binding domain containing protein n=1 Tax=Acrasis kona TaxID=1008807 RepID=A0AAW2YX14_9EUKA